MQLADLTAFRASCFAPSVEAPTERTIASLIDKNLLPGGVRIGKKYYIDLDTFKAAVRSGASLIPGPTLPSPSPSPTEKPRREKRRQHHDAVVADILNRSERH